MLKKILFGFIYWFITYLIIGVVLQTFGLNINTSAVIAGIVSIPIAILLSRIKSKKRNSLQKENTKEIINKEENKSKELTINENNTKPKTGEFEYLILDACRSKSLEEYKKNFPYDLSVKQVCGDYIYTKKTGQRNDWLLIYKGSQYYSELEFDYRFETIHDVKVFGDNEYVAIAGYWDAKNYESGIYIYKIDKINKKLKLIDKYENCEKLIDKIVGLYRTERKTYPIINFNLYTKDKEVKIKALLKGTIEEQTKIYEDEIFETNYDLEIIKTPEIENFDREILKTIIKYIDNHYLLSINLEYTLTDPSKQLKQEDIELIYQIIKNTDKPRYFIYPLLYKTLVRINPKNYLLLRLETEIYNLEELFESSEETKRRKKWKAKALRTVGEEILNFTGNKDKALKYLRKALELDDKIGVKRLAEKLEGE